MMKVNDKQRMLLRAVFLVVLIGFNQLMFAAPNLRLTAKPGTVALIFDDGPHPVVTPKVLNILKRNHVKATFFLLGYHVEKYPKITKAIVKQGNVIGSHALFQMDMRRATDKTVAFQIKKTRQIIESTIGRRIYCMSPPYLHYSQTIGRIIKTEGMTLIPQPTVSYDSRNLSVATLVKRTVDLAHSGASILLHDSTTRVVFALPEIIKGIRKKGLGFSLVCVPSGR